MISNNWTPLTITVNCGSTDTTALASEIKANEANDIILESRITSLETGLTTATNQIFDVSLTSNFLTDKIVGVESTLSDLSNLTISTAGNFAGISGALTQETKARADADIKLSDDIKLCLTKADATTTYATISSINTEITNRTNADIKLSDDIKLCLTKADATTTYATITSLADEAKIRYDTDAVLSRDVHTMSSQINSGVGICRLGEVYTASITNLGNLTVSGNAEIKGALISSTLTAETTARTSADSKLTSDLNTEITNRTNDIKLCLKSSDAVLTYATITNLNAEIKARQSTDTKLTYEVTSRVDGDNTLTTNLNTEITNRTNQYNALSAMIPTATSGTLTVIFNDTINGGTATSVSAKYVIMFNTVCVFRFLGFGCNVGSVARSYIYSQPVLASIRPSIGITTLVKVRKTSLIDAVGKLHFDNGGVLSFSDLAETDNYFPANGIGAGLDGVYQLTYLLP